MKYVPNEFDCRRIFYSLGCHTCHFADPESRICDRGKHLGDDPFNDDFDFPWKRGMFNVSQ